jgi:hypothetical protein
MLCRLYAALRRGQQGRAAAIRSGADVQDTSRRAEPSGFSEMSIYRRRRIIRRLECEGNLFPVSAAELALAEPLHSGALSHSQNRRRGEKG